MTGRRRAGLLILITAGVAIAAFGVYIAVGVYIASGGSAVAVNDFGHLLMGFSLALIGIGLMIGVIQLVMSRVRRNRGRPKG